LVNPIKRLLAPKHVRAVLGAIDDFECQFESSGPELGPSAFALIRPYLEKLATANPAELARVIGKEMSARQFVAAEIGNIAGDLLESGEYHAYRGWLNPLREGPGLRRLFNASLAELVSCGALTEEFATQQRATLEKNIQGVG